MYAFLGVASWEGVVKGNFVPSFVVCNSLTNNDSLIMRSTKHTDMHEKPPAVVNSLVDEDAERMIEFACGTMEVRWRGKKHSTRRMYGLLIWYECDIYARPNGRMLFVCTLPNYNYKRASGPRDRPHSWRMADVPLSEPLPTVVKPKLEQKSRPTKEKENNE